MPAALVPRSWDFDPAPGKPNLIPLHDSGPLEQQLPPHEVEGVSGQPSGELPSILLQVEDNQTPPLSEPRKSDEPTPPPSVTIVPPTLRGPPLDQIQLQHV